MNVQELMNTTANVQIVINALDLKEVFLQWNDELKQNAQPKQEEKYLTTAETAKRLNVDVSTLWRWNKQNYIVPIKLGRKTLYKESDILKILEG